MKFHFKTILAVLAVTAVAAGCQKTTPGPKTPGSPERKTVTVTATIPEDGLATKVSLTQDETLVDGKLKGPVKLEWVDGDTIDINGTTFTVVTATISGGSASFTGDEPVPDANGKYTISYTNLPGGFAQQTQAGNGTTNHLQYGVTIAGASEYKDFTFSQAWASGHGATISQSSVLRLRAKLPADEAAKVQKVLFSSDQNIFAGGKELSVEINTPGEGTETDFVTVYATLPGAVTIPADAELWIRFQIGANDYQKYTHYRTFPAATEIPEGKVFGLDLYCVNVNKYANASTTGIGTSANPYLIGDQNQVAAINSLATGGQTTYFKMIDDVDMTGKEHNHINTNSGYTQLVNFDGNSKTISKLGKDFFYVFKGSIHDLTLDQADVTSRGIFAEYCQGAGNTITNVTVSNGTVNSSNTNVGGLIGQINSGSSGNITATITNCTVSNTNVTGAGVVGGVIGFANELVSISGCKYTGGIVTSSGRYVGGFLGSTLNVASVITDCQVEDATVNANHTDDARGGGFVGQLQTSCRVEGCTVGTPTTKVTVNTKQPKRTGSGTDADPYVYSKINSGGFVGVNYGTITKNVDVRSKAYVKLTSNNTYGTPLNLGGFVGFGRGTIEYCDAIVDMTSLKGQYIGGFAGYVVNAGTSIDNCTADGSVTGNNYTGGFAGYVDSGAPAISNCTAIGTVTAQSGCGGFVGQTMTGVFTNCSTSMICSFSGSNNGGFVGQIHGGTMTGCSSTGSVTATGGSTYGGFVGLVTNSGTTLDKCFSSANVTDNKGSYNGGFCGTIDNGTTLIKRCYASGSITSDRTYAAGFIGRINHASNTINVTIQNCYSTGNIINSNQLRGGFIAEIATVTSATISNCYATGAVVGSFRLGGLIGNVGAANITVEHCAAWNSEITASSHGSGNWSSGAVVGTAFPTCTLTDNYRKPDISLLAFWGNVTGYTWELLNTYQHPNVSSSNPLIVCEISTGTLRASTATKLASGQDNYPQFAYHGKVESGKTLSQLASSTLGWSGDVWDFSGPLPLLK